MPTRRISKNDTVSYIQNLRATHVNLPSALSGLRKNPLGLMVVSLGVIMTVAIMAQLVQQRNIASQPLVQELSSSFFDIKGKTRVSAIQNINDPWSEKGDKINVAASNSADMSLDPEALPESEEIASPTPTGEEAAFSPSVVTLSPTQYVAPDVATITVSPTISPTPNTTTQEPTPTIPESSPTATPESSIASIPERQNLQGEAPTETSEKAINRVIVKFKKYIQVSPNMVSNVADFADKYNMETADTIPSMQIAVLDTGSKSAEQAVQELRNDPMIEKVEPDYIQHIAIIPNDTNFSNQWGLHNTGQTVNGTPGTTDKDIDAPEAWDVETAGQADTIVAVIDSGVGIQHPDLIGNMWDGSSCKDINNLPVAGGCPNNGWDFANSDNNPSDDNGHGTHVAGIIAATANNARGVAGTSMYNNIKIMALKVGNSQGVIYTSAVLSAINFAKYNGAKVINASFGGASYSELQKEVIDQYPGLFIAAAGNGGSDGIGDNNDISPFYPCSYTSENIICVAATTQTDGLASFSNYGLTSVDVGAPGYNIYSSYISPTSAYSQNFESVTPPNLPTGWTKNTVSNVGMGTYYSAAAQDTVLYGDVFSTPYGSLKDYQSYSNTINLSGYQNAYFSLFVQCDTEMNDNDFLTLGISNGGLYTAIASFSEYSIIDDGGYYNSAVSWANYTGITIPQSYLVNNFKFSFRWYTDSDSNHGTTGDGCLVNNIVVTGVTNNTETYTYLNGTSMATPFVAGAAGDMYSKFTGASDIQIKAKIIDTAESLGLGGDKANLKRLNLEQNLIGFPDVLTTDTFYTYITDLKNAGVINGYPDGLFRPGVSVTRGAMAKFIKNGYGFATNTSCPEFPDVPPSDTFYEFITTLKCEGVIAGFPDGRFNTGLLVDRGAAMKFIINGLRKKRGDDDYLRYYGTTQQFPDVPPSHTFYEFIMSGWSNGIVNGYPDGYFGPGAVTDRGAMSKMVSNGRTKL